MKVYTHITKHWYLHLTFLVYTFLILYVSPHHEPWSDEAQAWLLARDSSLFELLFQNLRYEGSPGLWHLILMLPARFLNYEYFYVISGIIGVIGIYLILYRSPFKWWLKILIPFTYFFFFQYTIVARCYVLFLPLLPLIAIHYKNRHHKPYLFCLLIILLGNINLHGFLFSLSFFLFFGIEAITKWSTYSRALKVKHLVSFSLFALNVVFVILQILPAKDISFSTTGFSIDINHLLDTNYIIYGELFSNIKLVSYIVLIVSLIWFWQKKLLLLYLALNIPIIILFSIYYNIWHQGVLFLIWVFTLWLSFDKPDFRISRNALSSKIIMNVQLILIFITFSFHIYWSAIISYNDIKYDFSAGKKIAAYIKENNLENKYIYATHFWAISALPYFDHNIYNTPNYDKEKSYWIWKKQNDYSEGPHDIVNKQPDLIIFSRPKMFWYPDSINGYFDVQIDSGIVFWKDTIKEINNYKIYRKLN